MFPLIKVSCMNYYFLCYKHLLVKQILDNWAGAYAQKPIFNAHADVSGWARGLKFSLNLHVHPYFMYVSSKGTDESAHLSRLVWAFVAQQCDSTKISCADSNMFSIEGERAGGITQIIRLFRHNSFKVFQSNI